jgi:hypothetical protein
LLWGCQAAKPLVFETTMLAYLHDLQKGQQLRWQEAIAAAPNILYLRFQGGKLASPSEDLTLWYPLCALRLHYSGGERLLPPTTLRIARVQQQALPITPTVTARITEIYFEDNPLFEKLHCEVWHHAADPSRQADFVKVPELAATTGGKLVFQR